MELQSTPAPRILRFGVFEVDLHATELRKHGARVNLQDQPFKILALLIDQPGELITRDELRQKLWPADTFVNFDRSLNKAINKLRAALNDSAESPRFIETIPRHGYRFIAPVELLRSSPEGPEAEASSHSRLLIDRILPDPAPVPPPRRANGIWQASAVALGVVLLAAFAVLFRLRSEVEGASTRRQPRRSVAVLGFVNLSGRPDEAWLSTALSDWLTTELAAGDQLLAIPGERVARMRVELALPESNSLDRETLARIRKNVGADLVVSGSYATLDAKFGDQIRLDLHLNDAVSSETLASISETGSESSLFELVSRAAASLREKLGVQAVSAVEAAEVGVTLPSNPTAARFYSEGLARLRLFDALAARDSLEQAVALEPSSALCHSALAGAWAELGYDRNRQAEARKAFDLSSNLPREQRLLIEGRYREASNDWEKAIEIYRTLFDFFPDNVDYGLALADAQVNGGRGKDALATVAALEKLPSPFQNDPRIDLMAGRAAESQGDFKADLAAAERAAAKAEAAGASLLLAQARLDGAWAWQNLGDSGRAASEAEAARQLFAATQDQRSMARAETVHAIALQFAGDLVGAGKLFEESLDVYRKIGYRQGVAAGLNDTAAVLRDLGDLGGARQKFEEALAIYSEVGHQDGVALTKSNLGDVLFALGDLSRARRMYGESLALCRQLGDKSKAAGDLAGLGNVLRAQGDLAEAGRYEAQAIAAFEEIGDRAGAAQAQVALAELRLEQGNDAAAVRAARDATTELELVKAGEYQSFSYAVLARALQQENRTVEARAVMNRAVALASRDQNREAALFVRVTAARLRAASGNPADAAQAEQSLRRALAEANSTGFADCGLQARLILGELEMNSGRSATGRARLQALQKDAATRGFVLIAQEAARSLHAEPSAR